jgi:integrase
MPPLATGTAYRLDAGRWGLRYVGTDGRKHRLSPFPSRSAALRHYRDVVGPALRGEPARAPELTLSELIERYLERHSANVRPRTVSTLRERLQYAARAFGDVPLLELERMAGEIATWMAHLPDRSRYGIAGALRQCLGAAVRWGYVSSNPAVLAGANRQPQPRTIRVYGRDELEAISLELSSIYASMPAFAAATGLRPEELWALERRDVDRRQGVVSVRRTVSSGEVVELGKTTRSRRQVPLSPRALAALDALAPRLDTPMLFCAPGGGIVNANNFRNRQWAPAIEAAGIARPARIYDLRSTFASNALAAGVSAFELARIMGTSVAMVERHYGTLLDGAGAGIAGRLAAFEGEQDQRREASDR